jgi:hypothetical protein
MVYLELELSPSIDILNVSQRVSHLQRAFSAHQLKHAQKGDGALVSMLQKFAREASHPGAGEYEGPPGLPFILFALGRSS